MVLALLVGLVGCRPLYLPPVPQRLPLKPVAQLADASALTASGGTLELHLVLESIPLAGWLAVQWLAPDGHEAASDSVWVTPADEGQGRTLRLPARVSLSAGEWRAVVSLHATVLRQFRIELPAALGSTAPAAP